MDRPGAVGRLSPVDLGSSIRFDTGNTHSRLLECLSNSIAPDLRSRPRTEHRSPNSPAMNASRTLTAIWISFLAATPTGCDGNEDQLEDFGPFMDINICAPGSNTFVSPIDNPFFPLPVGRVWNYEGTENGADLALRITVLDETETVAGVQTRVLEEREWEDGELIEVSRNYFAQTAGGTVCYFGEAVDIYEGGGIVSHDGAWRADDANSKPGIFMPADPMVGQAYQQEIAPGIAEDEAKILRRGETVTTPAGSYSDTIRIKDQNPIDGDSGEKVYVRDVGLVIDGAVELTSIQ